MPKKGAVLSCWSSTIFKKPLTAYLCSKIFRCKWKTERSSPSWGSSGCGKTTLLNLILGIVEADGGQIPYNGEDLTHTAMEKRGFNIVFQDYALFPNLNVYQNITYGLKSKPGISTRQEVEELIDLLGLREHLGKRIDQLSGRAEAAGGFGPHHGDAARILLLDQPLSAFDRWSSRESVRRPD